MKEKMKKVMLAACTVGMSLMTMYMTELTVLAAEVVCEAEEVTANEDGTYTIAFELESEYAFAGGEFSIECQEGVAVTDVSYNVMTSAVSPTEARGYTWFGFFSGTNDYSEPVAVTMTVESEQNVEAPYITIAEAKVYTAEDGEYGTETVTVDKQVVLQTAGAIEPQEEEEQVITIEEEETALAGELEENTLPSANRIWIVIVCGAVVLLAGVVFLYMYQKRNRQQKKGKV